MSDSHHSADYGQSQPAASAFAGDAIDVALVAFGVGMAAGWALADHQRPVITVTDRDALTELRG